MRRMILAGLLILALVQSNWTYAGEGKPPGDDEQCMPFDVFLAMTEQMPHWSHFRPVPPDKVAAAVAFFNALPPPGDDEFDAAYLHDRDDGGGVLLVGRAGAICNGYMFRDDEYRATVRMLEGRGT